MPRNAEVRNELALAVDARGWVNREIGDFAAAENDFRRAFELLEKLVAEFPTVPRHREVLAKVCNSLGLLEKDTGRLDEAEIHLAARCPWPGGWPKTFPIRPEYRTILGRALSNLGIALFESGRSAESEPILREAIELNTPIMEQVARRHPGSVLPGRVAPQSGRGAHQAGKCRGCDRPVPQVAGHQRGDDQEFLPTSPAIESDLGSDLDSLAVALNALNQPKVDETFAAATAIFERLIADHPENVDYRIRQAMCLRNQGGVLQLAGRTDQAEPIYRKGLALLDSTDPNFGRRTASAGRPGFSSTSGANPGRECRGRLETVDRHLRSSSWPASRGPSRTGTIWPSRRTTSGCSWLTANDSLTRDHISRNRWKTLKSSSPTLRPRSRSRVTSASSWPNKGNGSIKVASRPTPAPP